MVQDNDYSTWNAYNNEYWPAEYLIDAQGRIRLADFGEGEYAAKERGDPQPARRSRRGRASARQRIVQAQAPSEVQTTPESYLGAEKAERFENGDVAEGLHDYGASTAPPPARTPALLRAAGGSARKSGTSRRAARSCG